MHYGVYEICDRAGGSFARLTGNMMKVEDPEKTNKDIWISRNQLEKVLDACLSLGENRETFTHYYNKWAGEEGARGDWSVWAFREALNELGYYTSGDTAENFCRKANQELLDAVGRKELVFDKAIYFTTQSRGFEWEEVPELLSATAENLFKFSTFEDTNAGVYSSGDRNEETRWMEGVTGVQTVSKMGTFSHLSGRMILKDNDLGDVWIRILDRDGHTLVDRVSLSARKDVRAVYPDYTHSENSGFSLWMNESVELSNCILQIWSAQDDALIKECDSIRDYEDDELILYIDSFSVEYYDPYSIYVEKYDVLVQKMSDVFRIIGKGIMILSLAAVLLFWVLFILKRTWDRFEPAIILTGFLLSGFILEFGVTVFNTWLHLEWFYSSGVTAIGQAVQMAALAWLIKQIHEGRKTVRE